MAAAEVESVTHRFLTSLGRGTEWDAEEFDTIASVIGCFKFGIFTTVLESKYAKDVDEGGMREAIGDVHDYYVLDVLKKVSIQMWAYNKEGQKGGQGVQFFGLMEEVCFHHAHNQKLASVVLAGVRGPQPLNQRPPRGIQKCNLLQPKRAI